MRALVMVLALAIVQSGCSVLFVDGPHVVDAKVVCTDSMKLPIVDGVLGLGLIATPFILDKTALNGDPQFLLYIPMWIAGGADVISSVIGYSKVKRCRTTSHAAT